MSEVADINNPCNGYDSMARVLYLYAKVNPGIRYVQGMNELCAVVYYLFRSCAITSFSSVEADTFYCFSSIMAEQRDCFLKSLDHAESGMHGRIQQLNMLLKALDYQLWLKLEVNGVDPTFYSLRWIMLLLSQELSMSDTLRLWDSLLHDPSPVSLISKPKKPSTNASNTFNSQSPSSGSGAKTSKNDSVKNDTTGSLLETDGMQEMQEERVGGKMGNSGASCGVSTSSSAGDAEEGSFPQDVPIFRPHPPPSLPPGTTDTTTKEGDDPLPKKGASSTSFSSLPAQGGAEEGGGPETFALADDSDGEKVEFDVEREFESNIDAFNSQKYDFRNGTDPTDATSATSTSTKPNINEGPKTRQARVKARLKALKEAKEGTIDDIGSFLPKVKQQPFLHYVCCGMLLRIREVLLAGDFIENMKILQNYPPFYMGDTLRLASDMMHHHRMRLQVAAGGKAVLNASYNVAKDVASNVGSMAYTQASSAAQYIAAQDYEAGKEYAYTVASDVATGVAGQSVKFAGYLAQASASWWTSSSTAAAKNTTTTGGGGAPGSSAPGSSASGSSPGANKNENRETHGTRVGTNSGSFTSFTSSEPDAHRLFGSGNTTS